ncbi:MAG: hypothetical protein HY927_04825 [Elusimicrobia bacterium]|nr:hypothetical protein [Elusimicrobiota bacterium]
MTALCVVAAAAAVLAGGLHAAPPTRGDLGDARRDLSGSLAVFPGAEGFGTDTPAGRGGRVIRVTTLAGKGPGSLREALGAKGPRVVCFEVSGTVRVDDDLEVREPFVTVAGETAPSPGVTVAGAGLLIRTHDVLVRHLRVRPGGGRGGVPKHRRRAIHVLASRQGEYEAYNVVVDHCSASWATDENVTTWFAGVRDVTVSNCIVAEGLARAGHPKGEHSKGMLVGDYAKRVAVLGNLFAHNRDRNPHMKPDTSVLVANNLVYDHGVYPILFSGGDVATGESLATVVGNVVRRGPSTRLASMVAIGKGFPGGLRLHAAGNDFPGARPGEPWSVVLDPGNSASAEARPPVWVSPLTVRSSSEAFSRALAFAGARPADRDDADRRVVAEVLSGGGRIIDSEEEVGGWPRLAERRRTLEQAGAEIGRPFPGGPEAAVRGAESGKTAAGRRTALELWLESLAALIEGRAGPDGAPAWAPR